MHRPTLATLAVLALAACEVPAPTQPVVGDLPVAMAPTENNGNGVQFLIIEGPATLVGLNDSDGNFCNIGFSDQDGGKTRSDFQRLNKDGSITIHVTDPAAPLTVQYEGVTYTGVGHAMAMGSTNETLTAYRNLNISAAATVTDGLGGTFRASCRLHIRNSFDFSNADIRVH